ncbi:MAG: protease modulator HflC [Lachnospiraceae bacterium]|jgi:membrane protease subunit HflC|nr:protease modulator HflC [Lachnospiraceae bacterium]MBR3484359.1 protease modulator HflC [Lachnospiraceae bacterium]MBR3581074.1 protease modulator HflC [Lachnospiraceae bacterium]MBR4541859.1 protease modulator HflC [Lachnospiraceae bacterium]
MSEYNNEKQAGDEKVERIRQPKSKTPLIVIAIIIFIAVVVLLNSMVVTKENEYTLIKQFGKVERIVPNAGLSFRIPFIQTTDTLPKTMLLYDLTASDVITQDKKTMVVDSYVLWRITDPLKFTQTLTNITNAEGRINTIVYNSMKNIISSMSQSEVISSRDGALSQSIMQNIGTSVEQYGIRFVSIETKHLDLPSDNKAAVYERMISERNNIAASYTANGESEAKMIRTKTDNEIVVSVSEAEAQAEKIIAEGEAEYMKILSEAYNTPDRAEFYTFVRALDAAKKSMKGDKTLILPKDSPLAELFVKVE